VKSEMRYVPGDKVWLKAFDDDVEDIHEPRQQATVIGIRMRTSRETYILEVRISGHPDDDGLREVLEDQIEGFVTDV
jgi:hypothetical protein